MKVLHSILHELNEQVHMCHTPRVLRGYIQCSLEVNNTSEQVKKQECQSLHVGTGPLWCVMPQNGQTHFKNLAANAAKFLKCAWPFSDIMH